MAKWIAMVLGALLVVTNGWWLYSAIDQAVTLSYRDQLMYEYANRIVALSKLSSHLLRGRSETEVRTLLSEVLPDEKPFTKDGTLNITWLSFTLDDKNAIVGVEDDQLVADWAKPDAAH